MYLEHFGLNGPPFKITPVTHFFFPGANRGEILDALIYAITDSEGIIKITGEVGSGKTMLCRMLLERLPPHMETVYLANPSLSREEMLHAIADGLGLNLEGQRVNVIMQALQHLLAQKSQEGKRVVVLVDEAHAMPLDTLEELRLLYNLQLGDHKLLQIVLFGQPELNEKLSQPNMRQLKDRIVHHFNMLPLSQEAIIAYLLFRMRAAGYHGPNVFSGAAVKLIGAASNGLMRRVNILADKALLAAFIENTHNIEVRHVQAAIRDSELSLPSIWRNQKLLIACGTALGVILLAGVVWFFSKANLVQPDHIDNAALHNLAAAPASVVMIAPMAASAVPSSAIPPLTTASPAPALAPQTSPATTLLAQRLAAAQDIYAKRSKDSASIQLFYTTEAQTARLEAFLTRAQGLGKLADIYILPTKINGKKGLRVLYGSYPDMNAARIGLRQLPQRYKDGFAAAVYLFDSGQTLSN
ncbi:MAG: AAA family ATPase [Gallionellaceae bacterium]|nr:AAA family ATPase [Gallionellaceae bacterium]